MMKRADGTDQIEGPTGRCEQCSTVVSVERRRCPSCGFAPAERRGVTCIAAGAAVVLLASVALLLAVPFGTIPLLGVDVAGTTATTLGLPGLLVSTSLLWGYRRQDRRTVADSTIF